MKILCFLLILIFCEDGVFAGSECPPRQTLYPCTCSNIHLNKRKMYTTVVCHRLENSDSLNNILPNLFNIEIDKFQIYESFWAADKLGSAGDSLKALPDNWMTLTKIKEMEIYDSSLSSCFACNWSLICRNSVTTSFKVENSTSSEKICLMCDAGKGIRLPWIGCMTKLQQLELSHGNIKSVTSDFFPLTTLELKSLSLSHNQISKIDAQAFKNLPNLKRIDLSHNSIEHVDHTFGSKTELQYVDLSYNLFKTVGGDLLTLMPKLISIKFAYNGIVEFKQSDWRKVTQVPRVAQNPSSKKTPTITLRNIDLTGNPIRCDCNLRWVNVTFPSYVVIEGTCGTPEEYKESRIRQASRHMIERCDPSGNIGTRKPVSTRPRY